MILEPARELAEQVHRNLVELSVHLTSPKLHCVCVVGGDDGKTVHKKLQQGTIVLYMYMCNPVKNVMI